MSMNTEMKPSNVTPSHYTSDSISTWEKISMVMENLGDYIHPLDACALFNIFKYFDRMGKKDGESAEKDAYKCADYIHNLLTGYFLNQVQDQEDQNVERDRLETTIREAPGSSDDQQAYFAKRAIGAFRCNKEVH